MKPISSLLDSSWEEASDEIITITVICLVLEDLGHVLTGTYEMKYRSALETLWQ
jgi:hypothetical protein